MKLVEGGIQMREHLEGVQFLDTTRSEVRKIIRDIPDGQSMYEDLTAALDKAQGDAAIKDTEQFIVLRVRAD